MFPRLSLLAYVTCPEYRTCSRSPCLFSHEQRAEPSRVSPPPAKRAKIEARPVNTVAAPIASTSTAPQQPRVALTNALVSHSPLPMRNELLKMFWIEFQRIVRPMLPHLAHERSTRLFQTGR